MHIFACDGFKNVWVGTGNFKKWFERLSLRESQIDKRYVISHNLLLSVGTASTHRTCKNSIKKTLL